MERMLAEHLISYFHYAEKPLNLIVDGAYEALAASIASVHGNVVIANLSSQSQGNVANVLCLRENAVVLLLAEPETYLRYRLPEYLDFSLGEPRICHMKSKSRVLIFPRDSLERMLSVPPREDADRKRRILTELHDDTTYRITTALGTDLCFKARKWLTLDFEICTAPVENSISGIIVVDGAVFYRRIKEKLIFEIKNGILQTETHPSICGRRSDTSRFGSLPALDHSDEWIGAPQEKPPGSRPLRFPYLRSDEIRRRRFPGSEWKSAPPPPAGLHDAVFA